MKYKIKVYNIWEYGQRKDAQGNPHQEDNIFPAYEQQKDSDRLFILCDGMGGHDAGEVASATVCEAMSKSILEHGEEADSYFSDAMLQEAIDAAFDELDKKDTGAAKKMGTTMTFLKLHDNGATIAHMGDSRVYQIRQGENTDDTDILFETQDHSLVNDMIKVGELTPEEAKHSRQKNIITRALQPHMERRPKADIKHITDIKAGDYFYLCSDGMLEEMDDSNIKYFFSKAAGSDEERVNKLKRATIDNRDNHSAIIVHILGVEGTVALPRETEDTQMGSNVGEVSDSTEEDTEMVSLEEQSSEKEESSMPILQVPPSSHPKQASMPKQKKQRKFIAVAVAALALIVMVVFAFKYFKPSDPKITDKENVAKPTPSKKKAKARKEKDPGNAQAQESNNAVNHEVNVLTNAIQNNSSSTPVKPPTPAKPGKPTPPSKPSSGQASQPHTGNPTTATSATPSKPTPTDVTQQTTKEDDDDVVESDQDKLKKKKKSK